MAVRLALGDLVVFGLFWCVLVAVVTVSGRVRGRRRREPDRDET